MRLTQYTAAAAAILLTVALLPGQIRPSKSVAGTVTGFKVDAHTSAILLQADDGGVRAIPFVPETEVIRIAPGDHDLAKGEPARVTDVVTGDRVLVSFVQGMAEARRIVLITATDITTQAQRSEQAGLAESRRCRHRGVD